MAPHMQTYMSVAMQVFSRRLYTLHFPCTVCFLVFFQTVLSFNSNILSSHLRSWACMSHVSLLGCDCWKYIIIVVINLIINNH